MNFNLHKQKINQESESEAEWTMEGIEQVSI